MKLSHSFALALLLVSTPAFADSKIEDGLPPVEMTESICDTVSLKEDGRMVLTPALAIPDNLPAGVTTPPMIVGADGTYFLDVVLELNMSHTWIGDVVARLDYYANCADATPAASANVICRPGGTLCGPGAGVGCSSNFISGNTLRFNDGGSASLPSAACVSATNVVAGCYKPTGTGSGSLSGAFDGLYKGGCFKLFLQDNAGADLGTLASWAVYSLNQNPVPTLSATWGKMKAQYR